MRSILGVAAVLAVMCALPASAAAQQVGKPKCQPGDKVETGLQGQVPLADRASGRAAEGYNCNLQIVGRLETHGWISLDTYGNCAYFSDTSGTVDTGTLAVDASDPAHPAKTDYLTAKGMGNTWESMKVNNPRGLLAAGHDSENVLDVYDVKSDCRHPQLLFSGDMPTGVGHEGTFSPDGKTFYMTAYGSHVSSIDLTDPRHPRELNQCVETFCQIHGGSISEDGNRGYFAQVNSPDGLAVVDTSQVQARKPQPEIKSISTLPFPWNSANQATIPVFYGEHPYVISFGELTINPNLASSGATFTPHCPAQTETNFDFPRIVDIADERKPTITSKLMNEVDNPLNCPLVVGDNTAPGPGVLAGGDFQTKLLLAALFVYDAHYCSVDRTHDPTLLGCAQSLSGVRFYDIRDPKHPKELAYYMPGTVAPDDPTIDTVGARPIIRSDLGQAWMVSMSHGFKTLQFADGVWPFRDTPRCPSGFDPYLAHYDLTYERDCGYAPAAPAGTPTPPLPAVEPRPGAAVKRVAPRGLTVRARRLAGRRTRFLVSGRLLLPAGIGAPTCRGGAIRIGLRSKRRHLATRQTLLSDRCTFSLRVAPRRRARGRFVVTARFRGTNRLAAVSTRPRLVR